MFLSLSHLQISKLMHFLVFFPHVDKSCYESLFNHEDMQEIASYLPVCHVEPPGQHEGAKTLPAVSVDNLSFFFHVSFSYCIDVYISRCICSTRVHYLHVGELYVGSWDINLTFDLSGIRTRPWSSSPRCYQMCWNTLGETFCLLWEFSPPKSFCWALLLHRPWRNKHFPCASQVSQRGWNGSRSRSIHPGSIRCEFQFFASNSVQIQKDHSDPEEVFYKKKRLWIMNILFVVDMSLIHLSSDNFLKLSLFS